MAARKRRGPKHPGVVLIKPDEARRAGWRARYVDPDSGAIVKLTLDPELTTAEARDDWAARKSTALALRRLELKGGAPKLVRASLKDAVDEYFEAASNRLDVRTIENYRIAAGYLLAWAKQRDIVTTEALLPTLLPTFRDYMLAQRRQAYVKGRGRGARKAGEQKVSPQTINWKLRAVKTILNDLRLRGYVPLTRDAIGDGLKLLSAPIEAPDFLRPSECQQALEAALRHDAETFTLTRAEHTAGHAGGTTPRYAPIAPFAAIVLLTGMRLNEALALKWAHVDLDALDPDGQVVGELRLPAEITKTKRARTVGLDVSPSLRGLLAAMRLRAGRVRPGDFVFGGAEATTEATVEAARRRLVAKFGAPANFGWQIMRSTCSTALNNAPGIYGGAAAFMSAKRLGHSVNVSEKHYAGQYNGIPRAARTLEAALQVEPIVQRIVAAVGRPVERRLAAVG